MEKQNARTKQRRIGLLVIFLFASAFAVSEEYFFKSTQEYIFTESDNVFVIDIPDVASEQLTLSSPSFSRDVSFVSARKESIPGATRIVVILTFHSAGTKTIPPFPVKIKRHDYKILFPSVTVYENPSFVQPKVSLEFDSEPKKENGKFLLEQGKKVSFTLYVTYAVQVVDIEWSVPEDSFFEEKERYTITDRVPRGSSFSAQKIPVVSFYWTPLRQGDDFVPSVSVFATSYSGLKVECFAEPVPVFVVASQKNTLLQEENVSLDYAFALPQDSDVSANEVIFSENDLQHLLKLRSEERHSIPIFSSASKKRAQFEAEHGITNAHSEESVLFFYALVFLFCLSVIGFVIFALLKKKRLLLPMAFCAFLFLTLSFVYGNIIKNHHALFAGGDVYTIPENGMESGVQFASGSRVRIVRVAGKWTYVCYNDSYGWVHSELLYEIK